MSQESMPRNAYPSDLTDEQWAILEALIPPCRASRRGGRPRDVEIREVVNTILYLNRSGCQWDMLPHDLVPKSTAFGYFSQWRDDGTWTALLEALRTRVRVAAGREPTPSALCIDSLTVKTTEVGGDDRGYDGGKKISGHKRHLLVDTLGLLVAALITSAALDDGGAAPELLGRIVPEHFPRVQTIFGDSKYHNHALNAELAKHRPVWRIEVQRRPEGTTGFTPLAKRWVVERTNAWNGRCRRHSKDYERTVESSAAMIVVSHVHLLLRRLTRAERPEFGYRLIAA